MKHALRNTHPLAKTARVKYGSVNRGRHFVTNHIPGTSITKHSHATLQESDGPRPGVDSCNVDAITS
jgi:hypothetical protein